MAVSFKVVADERHLWSHGVERSCMAVKYPYNDSKYSVGRLIARHS